MFNLPENTCFSSGVNKIALLSLKSASIMYEKRCRYGALYGNDGQLVFRA